MNRESAPEAVKKELKATLYIVDTQDELKWYASETSCRVDDVVAYEGRYVVKDMVANQLNFMTEEKFDSILGLPYHSTQTSVQWVVYSVVRQDMLHLVWKEVVSKPSDIHMKNIFNTDVGSDKIYKIVEGKVVHELYNGAHKWKE